jgi:hypothetical protein
VFSGVRFHSGDQELFWFGAIAIGVVSVVFAKLADLAQRAFTSIGSSSEFAFLFPLLITPLGFMLSAYLAAKVFPNSQGSGIPQAIAARHLQENEDRERLLSLKTAIGKIMLTILGLFCGASIGHEGPTVQVGGSIMLAVARFGGMAQARDLILAGSVAGITAAFNTPLAGIVFAIEEMSRTYQSRANGIVLTAVILSGIAALALVGSYNYFGEASATPTDVRDWGLVLICGVGGGALGACFSGFALHYGQRLRRWVHPKPLARMVAVAGICGLAVAIISIASCSATFGTGYEQARGAVEGHAILRRKTGGKFSIDAFGYPWRHLRPFASHGRGIWKHRRIVAWHQHRFGCDPGDGRISFRCRASSDDSFRHHPGNNRRSSGRHPDHGCIHDRLHHVKNTFHEPLYHGLSRVFIAAALRTRRSAQKNQATA